MRTEVVGSMRLFVVSLFVAILALPGALAQDGEDKPKSPKSDILAIVGGDIHTAKGDVLREGVLLIRNGIILDVGQDIEVPEHARVIDAKGKVITPGFISISMSGIGTRGGGRGGRGGGGEDQEEGRSTDGLRDTLNPFDRNIKYALAAGITAGCVQLSGGGGGRRRGREGEPVEEFLGFAPEDIEPEDGEHGEEGEHGHEDHNHDFGPEETSTCACCGLTVIPTEPITPPEPTAPTPQRHAVLKMSYGHLGPMLVNEHAFYDLPRGGLISAQSRHDWRRNIRRIRDALREEENSVDEEDSGFSSRGRGRRGGASDEDLRRLVLGEVALRTEAQTVDEIRDMIALAQELDYSLVLQGVSEGWLVASEIGEAEVPVIFTPRRRRQAQPGHEGESGSSIESSGIFERSGVSFAIAPLKSSVDMMGIAGRDLTSLPLEAAFAVRGGASEQSALQALTIVPARMLGLDDRIGSLEKGKDADVLILDGPPLDYRTFVDIAIVDGHVCYDRVQDGIYPIQNSN